MAAQIDNAAQAPSYDGEDVFVAVPGDFRLETGDALPDAQVRLRRYGCADGPVVIVSGGISSGRFVAGADGWWSEHIGPGKAIDLDTYCVFGFDFAPVEDHRVRLSPRDQARLIATSLDALGIGVIEAWVGSSYGGSVGLNFAAYAPARVKRLCVLCAAHKPAALARGWRGVQRRVVEFAIAQGDINQGLALARQLAMITYRSADEFETRFEDGLLDDAGRSGLDRYLIARGEAYIDAMAPQRWLSLSESIDRCVVAPEEISAPVTLVACPTDQIAPLDAVEELGRRVRTLAALRTLPSLYGHDSFLKEPERVGAILREFLHDD
ncbi:MAG TPA: homoserine O-succinyltransferase [Verrucomicrobiae bacterium]|nr:homoserine O-succinyltransferase [Verrucomicrobiae bacterium]